MATRRRPRRQDALLVEFKNKRPVALADLTGSFSAFELQYLRFLQDQKVPLEVDATHLYVAEIKTGSIIAELYSLADQASFIIEHKELVAGFVTHLSEVFQFFLGKTEKGPELADKDLRQISQIVEPVAKDGGSQYNLSINSGGGPVAVTINSVDANAIQNGIARQLARLPDLQDYRFRKESLTLYQARDDARSKTGDRGTIEKFSTRPLKLIFENEDAKQQVLDQPGNIFRQVFIVDGEVSMVDGKPAVYKIIRVHDVFEKPD